MASALYYSLLFSTRFTAYFHYLVLFSSYYHRNLCKINSGQFTSFKKKTLLICILHLQDKVSSPCERHAPSLLDTVSAYLLRAPFTLTSHCTICLCQLSTPPSTWLSLLTTFLRDCFSLQGPESSLQEHILRNSP